MSIENFIQFENVTFTYPAVTNEIDENGKPVLSKPVFQNFSVNLEGGFVNLVGPNATGKSTFMLLASGRLCPQYGSTKIFGVDTKKFFVQQKFDIGNGNGNGNYITLDVANEDTEEEKNLLASFVYQNMEFETEEKVSELLETVYTNGAHKNSSSDFFSEVIKQAELEKVLNHKLTGVSKGEIQRVLFAFSVLYGSKSIFMDEPFFAMEKYQTERALEYLRSYSRERNIPVYISMHDLDLTKKYADKVMLFYPDKTIEFGTPQEILLNESLEKSYGVPYAMLRDTETFTRKTIAQK